MRAWLVFLTLSIGARAAAAGPAPQAFVMRWDLDWRVDGGLSEKVLLLSLQGLANRSAPQFYVIHPHDYQWEITGPLFDFYKRKHGVRFAESARCRSARSRDLEPAPAAMWSGIPPFPPRSTSPSLSRAWKTPWSSRPL